MRRGGGGDAGAGTADDRQFSLLNAERTAVWQVLVRSRRISSTCGAFVTLCVWRAVWCRPSKTPCVVSGVSAVPVVRLRSALDCVPGCPVLCLRVCLSVCLKR